MPDPTDLSPDGASPRGEVTRLLGEAAGGNRPAFDRLFPLVYEELKGLASNKLRMERANHTLNTTALVHEAYVKLVDQDRVEWQSRAHFFAVASRAMRRILVSHARTRNRHKRGGGARHVPLQEATDLPDDLLDADQVHELLALDQALEELAKNSSQAAEVVQYRFFGGLGNAEIAEVLGLSEVTVRRRWRAARAWLRRQLGPRTVERTGTMLVGDAAP